MAQVVRTFFRVMRWFWGDWIVVGLLATYIVALLFVAFGVACMWAWAMRRQVHYVSKWWHEGYERSEDE